MKWIALCLSCAVAVLWAPVVPRVAVAHAASPVEGSAVGRVLVVEAPSFALRTVSSASAVCGASVRTVGEWLNQTWCDASPLQVVEADTDSVRISVIDELPLVELSVQYAEAVLEAPAVRNAAPPDPAVAEAPVLPAWYAARSATFARAETTSAHSPVHLWMEGQRPVHVQLRC